MFSRVTGLKLSCFCDLFFWFWSQVDAGLRMSSEVFLCSFCGMVSEGSVLTLL